MSERQRGGVLYSAPGISGPSAVTWDLAGNNIVIERDASDAITRRYVWGPGVDEPLVWYEGSGTTDRRWLHADERGSVVAVSNASGAVISVNKYDEYGNPQAGNVGRFGYTGQVWLPELGLHYYKARMYAPKLGRFMQTDPIGYADGINWYAYVGGDPVNFVDPLGLHDICQSGTICPKIDEPDPPEIIVTGERPNFAADFAAQLSISDALNSLRDAVFGSNSDTSNESSKDDKRCSPSISKAEAAAAKAGNRRAFWKSRANRGDPMADTALSILNDSGLGWVANEQLFGAIAKRERAEGRTFSPSAARLEMGRIGVSLMRQHVNAVNRHGSPTAAQIAQYHYQVFRAHRLPNSTFGGTPFTGSSDEAEWLSFLWKKRCD